MCCFIFQRTVVEPLWGHLTKRRHTVISCSDLFARIYDVPQQLTTRCKHVSVWVSNFSFVNTVVQPTDRQVDGPNEQLARCVWMFGMLTRAQHPSNSHYSNRTGHSQTCSRINFNGITFWHICCLWAVAPPKLVFLMWKGQLTMISSTIFCNAKFGTGGVGETLRHIGQSSSLTAHPWQNVCPQPVKTSGLTICRANHRRWRPRVACHQWASELIGIP